MGDWHTHWCSVSPCTCGFAPSLEDAVAVVDQDQWGAIAYLGPNVGAFVAAFEDVGTVVVPC